MSVKDGYRTIQSLGVPHHAAQRLKSLKIEPQNYFFRVPAKPTRSSGVADWSPGMFFGVALDGVPFSQLPRTVWNGNPSWVELYAASTLDIKGGMLLDNGAYVYGGAPKDLVSKDLSHVGYAADGFPIFVSKANSFKPSYRLKKGDRPAPPEGPGLTYRGNYIADYEYIEGLGHLDRCNGILVKNKYYIYILTRDFPQMPLCWSGVPDRSFATDIDMPRVSTLKDETPEDNSVDGRGGR